MPLLIYNNIVLSVQTVKRYRQEPVYHENDLLYTRHELSVRCLYHPLYTSYIKQAGLLGPPTQAIVPPAVTAGSLKFALMRPRCFLTFASETYNGPPAIILQSPPIGPGAANPPAQVVLKPAPGGLQGQVGGQGLDLATGTLTGGAGLGAIAGSVAGSGFAIPGFAQQGQNTSQEQAQAPKTPPVTAQGGSRPASPLAGVLTDSNGGPFPLSCDVVEISGTKTFQVDFTIETFLNDTYEAGTTPALLSNVWVMTQDLDEDLYTTQTVEGEAVFDLNRLALLSRNPAQYAPFFTFPIPPGFRRSKVTLTQNREGNAIQYRILDEEEALHLNAPNLFHATRVEGTHSVEMTDPGGEARSANVLQTIGLGALAASIAIPEVLGARKISRMSKALSLATGAAGAALTLSGSLYHLQPVVVMSTTVRVYGDADSLRTNLQLLGLWVVFQKTAGIVLANQLDPTGLTGVLNKVTQGLGFGPINEIGTSIKITEDIVEKAVQVDATYTIGPVAQAALFPSLDVKVQPPGVLTLFRSALQVMGTGAIIPFIFMPALDATPLVLTSDDLATAPSQLRAVPGQIQSPTFLQSLVSSAMQVGSFTPPAPSQPGILPLNQAQLP